MKNSFDKINLWLRCGLGIMALQICQACREEEVQLPIVQFHASKLHVTEGGSAVVSFTFSRPSPGEGFIRIATESNATMGEHYASNVALKNGLFDISVRKGQSTASFQITTFDNAIFENTKFIIFTISSQSDWLRLGEISSLTFTIADDEGPSEVSFESSLGTVEEDDTQGIVVQIPLSSPAKGAGSISVAFNSPQGIEYGKNFITIPAAKNNLITLNVGPDDTSTSIRVIPIPDQVYSQLFFVSFSIKTVFGAVKKGAGLNYLLNINDNIVPSIVDFVTKEGSVASGELEGIVVEISLSIPAQTADTITVNFSNLSPEPNGTSFTTIPASSGNALKLPIALNATKAIFSVLPVNNSVCHAKSVNFFISLVTGSLKKGKNTSYLLTIESAPAVVATFAVSGLNVAETSTTHSVVRINLSEPAKVNETYWVNGTDYSYDFYYGVASINIIPTAITGWGGYSVPLTVQAGATSIEFLVKPIDNTYKNEDVKVEFYLPGYSTSGCIRSGPGAVYKLMILDND